MLIAVDSMLTCCIEACIVAEEICFGVFGRVAESTLELVDTVDMPCNIVILIFGGIWELAIQRLPQALRLKPLASRP